MGKGGSFKLEVHVTVTVIVMFWLWHKFQINYDNKVSYELTWKGFFKYLNEHLRDNIDGGNYYKGDGDNNCKGDVDINLKVTVT